VLIKHFGGVYMGDTTMMTQPLDWLFDIKKESVFENTFGDVPNIQFASYSSFGD
jgi:mannosyltransferase OCH1-like enzyme